MDSQTSRGSLDESSAPSARLQSRPSLLARMSKPSEDDPPTRKPSMPSSRTLDRSASNFERSSVASSSLGRAPTMRHKSVAVLPTSAADKFMGHAATASASARRTANLPWYIIHPMNPWYRLWWYTTVAVAAITAWLIPYLIAFTDQVGLWPYGSAGSIIQYVLTALITIDICVTFFVARFVEGELITDLRQLAKNYLKLYFWIDVFSVIPFETIAAVIAGYTYGPSDVTSQYLNLLKLTYMLRCYRIQWFFAYLTYNLSVSLVATTVIKNLFLVFIVQHFFACGFYFIARQYNFGEWTWVGQATTWFSNASTMSDFDMYIYALYWSLVTFASVGYGDIHAWMTVECVWSIIFIIVSVFLLAYVIGSTTLAIIKGDERVGKYRERMHALMAYSKLNDLPSDLKESMQIHIKLHFNNEQASDEAVLRTLPATIRRRVLRFLYLEDLHMAYIFQDCKQRFLDALLAKARVELYLPNVEVLNEGEYVNDLFVVVSGELEKYSSTLPFMTEDVTLTSENASVHGTGLFGTNQVLGEGDVLGEIAFITGTAQLETVRTRTACRLLAITRSAYNEIAGMFPISARTVLENLLSQAEILAKSEFRGLRGAEVFQEVVDKDPSALTFQWASAEALTQARKLTDDQGNGVPFDLPHMTTRQEQVMSNWFRVRAMLQGFVDKHDEDRILMFLTAASHGNTTLLQKSIEEGFDVNSADYDRRSALHLAAVKGFDECIALLLSAGADPNVEDAFQGTPLWEACKHRHEATIALLVKHGARLGRTASHATLLCQCVYDGDLDLLKCLLLAGCNVNAGDYDARTALHISAAEGNLPAVRLLLEVGRADVTVRDRWNNTPLMEARRVNAVAVMAALQAAGASASNSD